MGIGQRPLEIKAGMAEEGPALQSTWTAWKREVLVVREDGDSATFSTIAAHYTPRGSFKKHGSLFTGHLGPVN